MYEDEIKILEERIVRLREKQEMLTDVMTWEEACTYMAQKGTMHIRNANHATFHGYMGIGILYTEHVVNSGSDDGYWKV